MPLEWTALVGPLLTLTSLVVEGAQRAQRYRKKCRLLAHRVHLISQHLHALEQSQWTPDPPETKYTLECLRQALDHAEGLVGSCQRKRKAFDFFKAFRNRGQFSLVNKRIDHIMETFHMSNRTLLMLGLYGDHTFMVVLETLLEDGACRRLPQDKKENLEKAMNKFPHNDNMPQEKKKILESIRSDLRHGSSSWQRYHATSGSSTYNNTGQNQNQNENQKVVEEVTRLAIRIVEEVQAEAVNQLAKDEVERVAQLAKQVVSLLPHLQSLHLQSQEAAEEVMVLVNSLRDELDAAHGTIMRRSGTTTSCVPSVVSTSSSRQLAKRITELGNRIEQVYQNLMLIVIRQIIINSGSGGRSYDREPNAPTTRITC